MPAPTDTLRAKTDAELLFFVENPSFYQPALVDTARQELRRRGALSLPTASATPLAEYAEEEEAPARRGFWLLGLAVLLGVAALSFWGLSARQATQLKNAARPGHLLPDSLKLATVATQPLPTFNTEPLVAAQLASVPTAEKQEAQALRQFRGLSQRFWAADTQSEYLTEQAHAGKTGPMFADQALVVRENWRAWNKAVVYSYRFGPVMKSQFERMAKIASSQQHILSSLPGLLPGRKFLTDKEMQAREAEVQDWLAGLRRVSPVTGRPYRVTVLQAHF